MYSVDIDLGGNIVKQLGVVDKSVTDIRSEAKALQSQFDVIKLPPMGLPSKNPFRDIVPSAAQTVQNEAKQVVQPTTVIQKEAQSMSQGGGSIQVQGTGVGGDIAQSVKDAQEPVTSLRERMGTILEATLDIQRGWEWMQYPLQNAPERWDAIRTSIVDTLVAAQSGDFTAMFGAITTGFDESLGMINDFRSTWEFAKEGFQGAKTIFGETFKVFTENAMNGIQLAKSMGATFLTETLPSLLSFVDRGVVSMVGYVASLMGATGAQMALNVAMDANPIGLIVLGIAAIGVGVYSLISYWDTVKGWLVNFTMFFIKNNPFSWLVDITDKMFPGFKQAVYDTFGKIYEFIDKYFIQPIKWAIGWIVDQAKSITGDVNAAIQQTATPSVTVTPSVDMKAVDEIAKMGVTPKLKMPTTNLGIDKKTREITGENKQVKNINININSLISGGFTIITNKMEESEQKVKDKILQLLTDATNQVNYQ